MFNFLTQSATEGSQLTFIAALVISIVVAAGAGLRVFKSLKDKKLSSSSIDGIIKAINKDEELSKILNSVFTQECFQKSDTYEDFIRNIHEEAKVTFYNYIQNNITIIPEPLRIFVTVENMETVADSILGLFGFDGKKLTDMFTKYVEDLVIEDLDEVEEVDTLDEEKEEITTSEDEAPESELIETEVKAADNVEHTPYISVDTVDGKHANEYDDISKMIEETTEEAVDEIVEEAGNEVPAYKVVEETTEEAVDEIVEESSTLNWVETPKEVKSEE